MRSRDSICRVRECIEGLKEVVSCIWVPFDRGWSSSLIVWRVRSHGCTRANLSARLFVAHFSWKGLVPLDILLSILRFCLWAPSLNNAVYYVNRRCWLRRPERCPKRNVSFIGLFCVCFQFRFFFRTAQAYTVYYFKC